MFMLYFFFLADVFVTIIQTTNVLLALFRPVAAGIRHRRPFLPTEAIPVSVIKVVYHCFIRKYNV